MWIYKRRFNKCLIGPRCGRWKYSHKGLSQVMKLLAQCAFVDPENEDYRQNTNAYAFISKFKNFKQLKKSEEVSTIISSPKTKGYVENLNQDNKPIKIKEYSRMYGDTIVTNIEYNSKGEELFKKVVGTTTNEIKREVISEFGQNSRNGDSLYIHGSTKNCDLYE